MKSLIIIAALALSGCAELMQARTVVTDTGAKAGARFVVGECARLIENRKEAHAALHREIRALGSSANVAPFDCDGDGVSDF